MHTTAITSEHIALLSMRQAGYWPMGTWFPTLNLAMPANTNDSSSMEVKKPTITVYLCFHLFFLLIQSSSCPSSAISAHTKCLHNQIAPTHWVCMSVYGDEKCPDKAAGKYPYHRPKHLVPMLEVQFLIEDYCCFVQCNRCFAPNMPKIASEVSYCLAPSVSGCAAQTRSIYEVANDKNRRQ